MKYESSKDYWKQVVKDYISCLWEELDLTGEEEEQVAEDIAPKLLEDDALWRAIDENVEWYLDKHPTIFNARERGNQ